MNSLKYIPKIYFAGGMRTNWQDTVLAALEQQYAPPVIPLDPRRHGSKEEKFYTSWDLAAVELSDILFVYLAADNPGGHGLALEIGFALGMARSGAKPKYIIYVEDQGHPALRYLGMARACSDVTVSTLAAGIRALLEHLHQVSGITDLAE